jgi:glutaredoxin
MQATIHTLPDCPWCVKAKHLLSSFGIPYTELNGKSDNWPTVPYVEIDGKSIGGFLELANYCRSL